MTEDELDKDLSAAIDSDQPLTEEQKQRIAAWAAAAAAQPRTPLEQALAEVLAETVALADRTFPPGLNIRVAGETIEVLSRGELIATVSRSDLLARAAEIEERQARPN